MHLAKRIPWDEQEALLLFDTYEIIEKNPEKKIAIISALSINLRRRAQDNGMTIDDTFRNNAGISMRISEVDKILHPKKSGLTKTSELFRTTAVLYSKHRRSFLKKVQEVEEYRVRILADLSGFDIYESVVLLDAYLNIEKTGESKSYTARLVSAKLRSLATNRGCVFDEAYRSNVGVMGRLRKMEEAYQSDSGCADVPQVFSDAISLYRIDRSKYKQYLKKANILIGKIVLPEDVAKKERQKQKAKDAEPVQKTKYVKTKNDRKLKGIYPKEFIAVYNALEQRWYTDPAGVTATAIYLDLRKKYPRKTVTEILSGASWAKEIRAGKYVHVLGALFMSTQESNEKKYFSWLKKKIPASQYSVVEKNKNAITALLLQKRVLRKPLFLIDDAEEISKNISKVPSCFSNVKLRSAAVQMVTMYATYLTETNATEVERSEQVCRQTSTSAIEDLLSDDLFAPLCAELSRQNIRTVGELKKLDLWKFMNRFNVYSIGTRQTVLTRIQGLIGSDQELHTGKGVVLHVDSEDFTGTTPAEAFLYFCENMSIAFPLTFRSLIGVRTPDRQELAICGNGDCKTHLKMCNLNGYVKADLTSDSVIEFTRWICNKCGKKCEVVSLEELPHESDVPAIAQMSEPTTVDKTPVESTFDKQKPVDIFPASKEHLLIPKATEIVLKADMEGMSYDELRDSLRITMTLTKQIVAGAKSIVDVKGRLIHEEAFIDWEDGADALETILDRLMQRNNGYVSIGQLFEFARAEMNMFLNDNDVCDERSVYDIARHLFEKRHFHNKQYSFAGNMHISRSDERIGSNLDLFKKYAADQGGIFRYTGLIEYLESVGVNTGNLRMQMRLYSESIFFNYDEDILIFSEIMNMDEAWEKAVSEALRALFADVGDHIILRQIPGVWYDRLPALPGSRPWTPLLLQSILRFYSKEFNAHTIQAMDGQSIETLHTMLVENNSPIQNFGDVVISCLLENDVEERTFKAEDLRWILVKADILQGNELIWNMPKALKGDSRFAWDAKGESVTVMI